MKIVRLFWKEYREKRAWLLLLLATTVGVVFLGKAYTFAGGFDLCAAWVLPSMMAALLFGAGAFSSEIAGGTADFLMSKPISWRKLLAAKAAVAVAFVALTALLVAVAFRLTSGEQYAVTYALPSLANGVGAAVLAMGLCCLVGLASSVVLPGAFGGAVVVVAAGAGMAFEAYLWADRLHMHHEAWTLLIWPAAMCVAAVAGSRFGLTLPTPARTKNYARVLLISVVALTVLTMVAGKKDYGPPFLDGNTIRLWTEVGPEGKYAVVSWMPGIPQARPVRENRMVRMRDQRAWRIDEDPHWWWDGSRAWRSANQFCYLSGGTLWSVEADGQDGLKKTALKGIVGERLLLSPDGTFAAVKRYEPNPKLLIVDLDAMKPVGSIPDIRHYWWQSDTQIGYTDTKRNRHIVSVVPEPRAKVR